MKVDAAPILKSIGEEINQIQNTVVSARRSLILMHNYDKHIHITSSLSSLNIIATLLMKYIRRDDNPLNKDWFILSKGHAAPALYAVLTEVGLIPRDELVKINSLNGVLQNHPDVEIPGVDMSTGSLGQGISFAVGIAVWIKLRNGRGRVFVLMGDGEQDEGQVWEAITHAAILKLSNLIVIIDWNGFQLDGKTEAVKSKHYLPFIWSAIGWKVLWCDGHDVVSIVSTVNEALESDRPTVIFAKTMYSYEAEVNNNDFKQNGEESVNGEPKTNWNARCSWRDVG
ncbi:MAG: thiamine pyrophosphate-dependent enzyme [Ignisphaera sp.]|nr:thiamine pyrophosphate-dependent enzyme [Ignisphaera sp.]MCX8167565.1 thiamine pyrophosphate-dependent enzyme [Ignisphaera sp.]MDW8086032.1 1-deoxy-D-xylulose-5-phosphate synthase N-terminal domain-containing protein [Ignisphaera sp.]